MNEVKTLKVLSAFYIASDVRKVVGQLLHVIVNQIKEFRNHSGKHCCSLCQTFWGI